MMKTLLLAFCLAPLAPSASPAWPTGKACAVSLTYDDGIESQILNAAVDLTRSGIRATFFPTGTGPSVTKNPAPWKLLVARGHELASHTMVHPCPGGMGAWQKGNTLEEYDDARMSRELDDSIAFIKGLGQKTVRSFAYPCGASWIGAGDARHSYKPLVAKRFQYVRGVGNQLADPATVDLSGTPAWDAHGMKAGDWKPLLDRAKSQGAWLIVVFHGVGGDYLSCDADSHQALLGLLEKEKDSVWVAPFGLIAGAVDGYQKSLKK